MLQSGGGAVPEQKCEVGSLGESCGQNLRARRGCDRGQFAQPGPAFCEVNAMMPEPDQVHGHGESRVGVVSAGPFEPSSEVGKLFLEPVHPEDLRRALQLARGILGQGGEVLEVLPLYRVAFATLF